MSTWCQSYRLWPQHTVAPCGSVQPIQAMIAWKGFSGPLGLLADLQSSRCSDTCDNRLEIYVEGNGKSNHSNAIVYRSNYWLYWLKVKKQQITAVDTKPVCHLISTVFRPPLKPILSMPLHHYHPFHWSPSKPRLSLQQPLFPTCSIFFVSHQ